MKILITGITGLIGNHLMQVLQKNGYHDIRGNYFSNRNLEEYTSKNIEMIQADVADEKAIHNITKDCDVVVHTAARVIDFGTKKQFYEAHYDATHFLLKDAKAHNVKHFIYVSSVGVASGIDRNKIIPDETTLLVKTVIGKGSVWVLEPLKRMDTKLGLKLIDDGKHPACLLDAENLANGIFLCMTKDIARNQTYFFMDDWNISWKEYFTDLVAMKGKKVGSSMPFWLAYFIASTAEFIFPLFGKNPPIAKKSAKATGTNRTISTQKARKELGWTSVITYKESMKRIKESLS